MRKKELILSILSQCDVLEREKRITPKKYKRVRMKFLFVTSLSSVSPFLFSLSTANLILGLILIVINTEIPETREFRLIGFFFYFGSRQEVWGNYYCFFLFTNKMVVGNTVSFWILIKFYSA